MVGGCVYLPEKLAKVEPHLCRLNSFQFVALFPPELNRNSHRCYTKWTDLNLQLTNSIKWHLTISSEKTRAKHNDKNDRYKSARKTMGVVKVIRGRGGPKSNIYFSPKWKLVRWNTYYSKKHKLKYDFSTFIRGSWEFLSFDVRAAVQQRENSTLTPVPIVFSLQFKMASLFSTESGTVACSLDKYKALTPHLSPLPPSLPSPTGHFCTWVLPSWYFFHLECDRLINSYSEKQKLKIDGNI